MNQISRTRDPGGPFIDATSVAVALSFVVATSVQDKINAFNFRHGPDPDNHTDVASSDLIEVIETYWNRNTLRPPGP